MTRIVFAGLLVTIALAPLPFASNRPWSWSVLSLTVGVLLIGWALAAWRDRGANGASWRQIWLFALLFAVVVGWILVQASPDTPVAWHHPLWARAAAALGEPLAGAISLDPQRGYTALMRLLAYAGVFWLALQLGAAPERARRLMWLIALSGFAYCVYGLVVEFGDFHRLLWYEKWVYRGALTSTFVNRNSFATFAGLTLLVVIGLLFDEVRHGPAAGPLRSNWLRLAVAGLSGRLGGLALMATVIGSALLLTGSRGGLVSGFVGVAVLAVVYAASRGRRWPAVAALAAASLFALAMLQLSGDFVIARFSGAEDGVVDRLVVYTTVTEAIAAAPWLGHGYGVFETAFPMIAHPSVASGQIYDKAHNSYLEFAFELGVPAFAVMIGLLGGLCALCIAGVGRRRQGRLYPAVAVAATALVAVHALVDFSLQIPAVATTYAVLLGVGCAQALRPARRVRES